MGPEKLVLDFDHQKTCVVSYLPISLSKNSSGVYMEAQLIS